MPSSVSCPQCQRSLRVPDDLLGKKVKCPTCGTNFLAGAGRSVQARQPQVQESIFEEVKEDEGPSRKSTIREAPPARQSPPDPTDEKEPGYEEVEERRKRPSAKRRAPTGKPHRGMQILIFGLLALTPVAFVFGPLAWSMGKRDLEAMSLKQMDRTGKGMTNAGRILGIIGSIGAILGVLCLTGWFLFALMLGRKFMMFDR